MSKIAFVDHDGTLVSVAWTCLKEGHDVVYWIQDPEHAKIGDGLIPKVKNAKEIADFNPETAFVYCTPPCVNQIKKLNEHINVYGCSLFMERLEDERFYSAALANNAGIAVPRTLKFTNSKDAVDYVTSSEGRSRRGWVFKAEGGHSEVSSTHVTESEEHLLAVIDFESTNGGAKSFVLQERVEGIEISIEGWFDYRLCTTSEEDGWVRPFNSTLERKRLMAGDVGPNTDCMGSIVWAWPGPSPRLFKQTLDKITPLLKQMKYVGPLDGNFILDYRTRRPYFLEWTPRLGWNAFQAFMANLGSFTVGEFLTRLGRGDLRKYSFRQPFSAAINLYTPMAPDIPVFMSLDDFRLYPSDVYQEGSLLRTVGGEAFQHLTQVVTVTATGGTVNEATREVYEDIIPTITINDCVYRNDIGEQAIKDIELLEAWGYNVTKKL